MSNQTQAHDIAIAAAKMVPAVVGATYAGLTLSEWATILTIVYVFLQVVLLIPKFPGWWRDMKEMWRGWFK